MHNCLNIKMTGMYVRTRLKILVLILNFLDYIYDQTYFGLKFKLYKFKEKQAFIAGLEFKHLGLNFRADIFYLLNQKIL